ncbi:MAG: hypothetical protein R2911_19180 [Caldilineaceae bacterium]
MVVQGALLDIYLDNVLQIVRHHRTYADGCFARTPTATCSFPQPLRLSPNRPRRCAA